MTTYAQMPDLHGKAIATAARALAGEPLTYDDRHAIAHARITLDDKPARLAGLGCNYAQVYQIDRPLYFATWSWQAVCHIIANKQGRFRTTL